MGAATLHASAVLVGARAALIRGPSGAGKSGLALALIEAAAAGSLPFGRLVADDRAEVEVHHQRLLVRPASNLRGLIEIRGIGICRLPYEPLAVVGLVIDLAAPDAERMPAPERQKVVVEGIGLPRLAIGSGVSALPITLIRLRIWLGSGGLAC